MSYVLIEMTGLDILSVKSFSSIEAAKTTFDACCEENKVTDADDLSSEAPGTIAMAGDDAYSVQLVLCQTISAPLKRAEL